jgi:LacI family transcriptional regulator
MRDVAALAKVSLSTVSRVINADATVAPDLAVRVREAVVLLGYRRDLAASALRRADRISATIGLIVADVANPFHAALHRRVEDVARARGVLAVAGSSDEDAAQERELAHTLCARRVDGLIIAPAAGDHGYLEQDRAGGVALVFVDRPPAFLEADVVLSDHAGGARQAVAHLAAGGHRRIAFLGDQARIFSASERLRGYHEALAAAGLVPYPELVRLDLRSSDAACAATLELLDAPCPPTAVFAGQNLITVGAVRALRALGLQSRVALVGFDDIALADALDPGVTVVAQDPARLGETAAELLFARLAGSTEPFRRVVLPVTLIARGSGELPPPADAAANGA